MNPTNVYKVPGIIRSGLGVAKKIPGAISNVARNKAVRGIAESLGAGIIGAAATSPYAQEKVREWGLADKIKDPWKDTWKNTARNTTNVVNRVIKR